MKSSLAEALGCDISAVADEHADTLLRGIGLNFENFIDSLNNRDEIKSQLGLGHSYSR